MLSISSPLFLTLSPPPHFTSHSRPLPQAVKGRTDVSKIKVEEQRLDRMEKKLGGLQSDFEATGGKAAVWECLPWTHSI